MSNVKELDIGGRAFFIHKLNVWKQIAFAADLQRELVKPLLGDIKSEEGGFQLDPARFFAGLSDVISSDRLEFWVKKLLGEGIVALETEDGKARRIKFSEIEELFDDPMDVITLMRGVFEHNFLDFFKKLLASTGLATPELQKRP